MLAGRDIALTISSAEVYAVPASTVTEPAFPKDLEVFQPDDTEVTWTPGNSSVAELLGKAFTCKVAVDPEEANTKWKIVLPVQQAATLRDMLIVCNYSIAQIAGSSHSHGISLVRNLLQCRGYA